MRILTKIRALLARNTFNEEMSEEMRVHLDLQTEKNIATGMSTVDARYAARRQFGGVEQIKERCRDQRSWVRLELAWKELGFAVRSLRRAPGFSLAVLTTLALCIGPNTALLSVLYTLVYKPLPFPAPQQLVVINNVAERQGGAKRAGSIAQHADFAAHTQAFAAVGYFTATHATIGGEDGTPERAAGMLVSAELLPLLGVPLQVGRGIAAGEQTPGQDRVVILSDLAWRKRHNSDPKIIGREIRMDGEAYSVIGVAGRSFEELFNDVEFFRPYAVSAGQREVQARYAANVRLVGRLKPGVTHEAAAAELAVLERRFYDGVATPQARSFLDTGGYHIAVGDGRQELAEPIKAPLLLLQGGAVLVLLIGCVNVASLLLARTNAKRPELAIRQALGAGAGTLLRQMLAESFMLVGLAGAVGVGLALAMLRFMNHYLPTVVRHVPPIALDSQVLVMVFVGVLAIVLAMGIVPFRLMGRVGLHPGETTRASVSRRSRQTIGALVVFQVAVALVLLIGAGLLIHSFARVMAVKPGFDAERIVQGRVALNLARYQEGSQNIATQQRMLAAMREIPGVEAVSLTTEVGVQGNFQAVPFVLRDGAHGSGTVPALVHLNRVSPGYFSTMGIGLREGRAFRDDDDLRKSPVVVVDEVFAQRHFPGGDAVGRELVFGTKPPTENQKWCRIVGVVARAQLAGLEGRDGWPFVYLPFNQQPSSGFTFLVRSARLEADVVNEMRARVRAIDPGLALYATGSLAAGLESMLGNRRALMWLLAMVALLALALAAVGLYGVLNYDVSQRTREIGIRGAIGATRGQIVAMILRQGLVRASIGLAIGIVGAIFGARLLRKMLFDVSATDPVAYGGVAVLLLVVALLASWLPARRAAKVDPIVALRCE